ncbi:hypothetical protein C8J56DRAFT_802350 [Mycena floridula]|nr:hypothetical protein C8J56DRAFT_802350 [Mycena floridula]
MDANLYSFQRNQPPQTPAPYYEPIDSSRFYSTPPNSVLRGPQQPLSDHTGPVLSSGNAGIHSTPGPSRKRARDDDQNQFVHYNPHESPTPAKKTRKPPKSHSKKLEIILASIQSVDWTLGDFLFHLFQWKDKNGKTILRSASLGKTVEHFLAGHTTHFPGEILESWLTCPDGRVGDFRDDDGFQMYSTVTPFTEIKPVRQCLTSFAAQISRDKLRREAQKAVDIENGLHVTSIRHNGRDKLETDQTWSEVGASTATRTGQIIQQYQRLAFHFLSVIAGEPAPDKNGVVAVRKKRPISMVSNF